MGHHWKSNLFVTLVSLTLPFVLLCTYARSASSWNLLLAFLSGYTLVNYTVPFFTDALRVLPHPPHMRFFLANAVDLLSGPPGEAVLHWSRTVPNDGLIYARGFLHSRKLLILTTTEGLREVLLDKSYDYVKPERSREFLTRILGNGMIVAEGHEHKLQRKAVAPAFNGQHILELIPLFWQKSQEFADTLSAKLKKCAPSQQRHGVVEMNAVSSRVTLDIIGVAGFGRDFRCLANDDDELVNHYEEIMNPAKGKTYFTLSMVAPPWLFRHLPWSENTRFDRAFAGLRRTASNLLNEKRVSLAQSETGHKDILTVLLKSKTLLNDTQLTDQLLTFLAAGHETTASALSWAMHLLSLHPKTQHQLREDIFRTLGGYSRDNEPKSIKNIDNLPFLSAVCSEAFRLYPTVPGTARRVVRPTTLLGHSLEPGTDVLIPMWSIHRLHSIWGPDADEFRPERWLQGENAANGGASSPLAFITFLHGPRSCIGQGFARTELKYLLTAVLTRFKWEPVHKDEEVVRAGMITIKPLNGLKLRLTELAVTV